VGLNGPIMVEGVQVGATAQETTANARAESGFWRRRWLLSNELLLPVAVPVPMSMSMSIAIAIAMAVGFFSAIGSGGG
jgi:hypothetical protein